MRSERPWASSGRRWDDAVAVNVAVNGEFFEQQRDHIRCSEVVVRGGVEPPTFRFSGLRITVQNRPRWSAYLLGGQWYTPIDAGVRSCMRLEMRLARSEPGMRPVRLASGVAEAPGFYPCFRIDSRFMLRRGPIPRPLYARYQVDVQVRRESFGHFPFDAEAVVDLLQRISLRQRRLLSPVR